MPYGVCKVCGCTDNVACHNPRYGNCWWVDNTHEMCSHCAEQEIVNDPETIHCVNSYDPCQQYIAERLICCHCRHWHKAKDSGDITDENAFGSCDLHEWGSYGSDPMCTDFNEREEDDVALT